MAFKSYCEPVEIINTMTKEGNPVGIIKLFFKKALDELECLKMIRASVSSSCILSIASD